MVGSTRSKKSTLTSQILLHREAVIDKPVHKIIFYYKVWQELYTELREKLGDLIDFKNELSLEEPEKSPDNRTTVIIFDDLHLIFKQNNQLSYQILNYFTIYSNHLGLLTIFFTQNVFIQNEIYRTLSQNSNYIVLFKNFRNTSQVKMLANQICGSKKDAEPFMSVYREIMSNGQRFNYLILTLHPLSGEATVHTQIIPTNSLEYHKLEKLYIPSSINKAKKIKLY